MMEAAGRLRNVGSAELGREQETSGGCGDEKEWRPEVGKRRRRESTELHCLMLSG